MPIAHMVAAHICLYPYAAGLCAYSEREPIIATVYITETNATLDARNAAIAQIVEAIIKEVTAFRF